MRVPLWIVVVLGLACGGEPVRAPTSRGAPAVVHPSSVARASAGSQEPLPPLGPELDARLVERARDALQRELDDAIVPYTTGAISVYAGDLRLRDDAGRFPEGALRVAGALSDGTLTLRDRDDAWHIQLYRRADGSAAAPLWYYAQRSSERLAHPPRYVAGGCAECPSLDGAPPRVDLRGATFVGYTESRDGTRTVADVALERLPVDAIDTDTWRNIDARAASFAAVADGWSRVVEGVQASPVSVPGEAGECTRTVEYRAALWVGRSGLDERDVRALETRFETRCCIVQDSERGCAPQRECRVLLEPR